MMVATAHRDASPRPAKKRLRTPSGSVEETTHARVVTRPVHEDPIVTRAYADMLSASLAFFAREVLDLVCGPHVIEWSELVSTTRRLAINAARDHGKSVFFSYAYPIWRAVMEPGCEVYIFSRTQEQAMEFIEIILYGRNNLKGMVDVPSLADLVPDIAKGGKSSKDKTERATKSDLRLKNGSRIRAVSYGKAIRGRHPKYVVCDDVLNDDDMWSETVRRKNIEYFKSAIVNMPPPNGQIVVVGTPYHLNDLYGFLRTNKRYVFRRYPGILKDQHTGKERALFPWRWKLRDLKAKREEIGSVSFAREILCEPVTDELSVFPSTLFPPLYDAQLTLRPKRSLIRQRGWQVYMGVDLALSANVGADYTVIFTIGRDEHGNPYILDIERMKGLSFRKQLAAIERSARRYAPNLILIEANLFQRVFSDEMRRTTDLPVKPFITHATNKNPLDRGVPSLRILLENEKVVIPRGDEYSVAQTTAWIDECSQFGFVDGKLQGIGAHDDCVMAWWLAAEAVKAGGFSFSVGDDDDEEEEEDEADESWKKEMGLDGSDDEEADLDDAVHDEEDDAIDAFGI